MAPVTAAGADMEFDAQLEIDAGTAAAAPPANRWTVAIAAAAVMLTTGTLYSWAIFTQPLLVAFHWDVTTTTAAFAIANLSLAAVGTVIGGIWQDRVGPRRVALVGVTLWVSEPRPWVRPGSTSPMGWSAVLARAWPT